MLIFNTLFDDNKEIRERLNDVQCRIELVQRNLRRIRGGMKPLNINNIESIAVITARQYRW